MPIEPVHDLTQAAEGSAGDEADAARGGSGTGRDLKSGDH